MRNKAIFLSSILFVSGSAIAESSLLENVAEQAAKDTAAIVAPDAVKKVDEANQALENAKTLKENVEQAPEALKNQATEAVKESASDAVPDEAKKAVETVKSGNEAVKNLQKKAAEVPKSTKALKSKVKQKAAEKALDLLR